MKSKSMITLIMVVLVPSITNGFVVFPICTDSAEQVRPAVSGSTVIWSDYREGNWQIYGYDLSANQEFSIPVEHSPMTGYNNDRAIAIDGDTIVWMDDRINGRGIYGYNLSTNNEFLISSGSKHFPEIDGDVVVWENIWSTSGYDFGVPQGFDLGTGAVPAVSGDIVVAHNQERDVIAYNLDTWTSFLVTDLPGEQCNPDIGGDIVVWRDDRDSGGAVWDICGYDISTDSTFLIAEDTSGYPIVDSGVVVWNNGGYNLLTDSLLSIPIGMHPYVDGDLIVWEQGGDIYGAYIPEPATLLLLGLGTLMLRRKRRFPLNLD